VFTASWWIGLSLERLGCNADVRINGYLPVGAQLWKGNKRRFTTDEIYTQTLQKQQRAVGGFNAEVGTCLIQPEDGEWLSLYGAIGPYYYRHDTSNKCCCHLHPIAGGQVRLALRIQNYINVEVRSSYDPVFHTIVQGVLNIRIPFGNQIAPCCARPCDVGSIAAQPVVRNDLIVLDKPQCIWRANF
jgi:hypothetical protein